MLSCRLIILQPLSQKSALCAWEECIACFCSNISMCRERTPTESIDMFLCVLMSVRKALTASDAAPYSVLFTSFMHSHDWVHSVWFSCYKTLHNHCTQKSAAVSVDIISHCVSVRRSKCGAHAEWTVCFILPSHLCAMDHLQDYLAGLRLCELEYVLTTSAHDWAP